MSTKEIAVIVLAAGQGTRMKSSRPKVMHELAGRPMISLLLETVAHLAPRHVVVVVGPGMESVAEAVSPHPVVVQHERLGTAHAVLQAKAVLGDFTGDVLVLYGDTPLVTRATLEKMIERRRSADDPAVIVLGFRPQDGGEYGRLILGPDGDGVLQIIEHRDASPEQRLVPLCNSGVMCIDGKRIWSLVEAVSNDNAKREYYLTDIVALAGQGAARGQVYCDFVEGSQQELLGVNSRAELATAEAVVQNRLRAQAMDGGATLIDPDSVYFRHDTKIGKDVVIHPNVVFGAGVTVEDEAEIKSFSHIEGAHIGKRAQIGPFARLRPGAQIGEEVHIGNFVEIKKSVIEERAKINHLTYIGDAKIGATSNVGAGTITCNYDGFTKSRTEIGKGAFIGSNTSLVAPVTIGDGAIIGAGSVIVKDVEPDSLAISRPEEVRYSGWAAKFRARKKNNKKS